jgi:penicillin-binding protein 1A
MERSSRNDREQRPRPKPRKREPRAYQPTTDPSAGRTGARAARTSASETPPTKGRARQTSGRSRTSGSATTRSATTSRRQPGSDAGARPAGTANRSPRPGTRPAPKKRGRWGRIVRIALIVFALLAAAGGIAGCVVYERLAADLPDLSQGPAPLAETSVIYDRNGDVLVELFGEQNRTYVPLANIPLHLRQAVIATEDQNFYEHKGVDPFGIARALWVNITQGKHQGGSTITQQYVVNTFIQREDSLSRKIKEAMLAYELETSYSKDEILEKYLNTIYYGHGAYGVQAAAETYFGKSVGDLTTAQCALIAGVIKSPGSYSPRLDMEAAKNRRDTVLGQMLELGSIDTSTHAAAVAEPIELPAPKPTDVPAPYFVEWVKQTLIDMYGPDAVFKGGLRVTTTIDRTKQQAAETAITSILDQADDPSAAVVAIDPRTGEVLAMVGGKDFNTQQFNVAVQGLRQPGSSFKPFVLVAGLEEGISPEKAYESRAAQFTIPGGQTWKVSGSSAGGPMRLRVATEKSINSVFAQLILEVGANVVADTATRMGITTPINAVPAIALGSQEVTPLEMASAYGTLANAGTHIPPHGILQVTDVNGEVLYEPDTTPEDVLSPAVAYLATDMLKGVISRGTGTAAKIGRPAAGKTGTTQEYRDAWFVGYTPDLVASVWMGYPEGQIEMTNVHGRKVTGGSFPAQIWAAFMQEALKDSKALDFTRPQGLTTEQICLESGGAAGEFCENKASALFLAGHGPEPCEIHTGPVLVDLPNLIGMMKAEAIALLNSLKLAFTVDEQPVSGVPAGMVSDQTPRFGSQVATDTVVNIIVSTGTPAAEPPTAEFSYLPLEPQVDEEVTFDASESFDSDGEIIRWAWEFGDGTPLVFGETVTHTFTSSGTYTVTLWVTDDADLVASLPVTIEVQ